MHKLREELVSVNSQRKQQLVELGLLREEEKQRAARDHEAAVSKLKAESEKMRLELKKTHAAKTELMLEKASSRLKQIEKEYTQKLAKSSQVRTLNKTEQNQSKQEGNLSTKGLVLHSSTHFFSVFLWMSIVF